MSSFSLTRAERKAEHDRFDAALVHCVDKAEEAGMSLPGAIRLEWSSRFTNRAGDALMLQNPARHRRPEARIRLGSRVVPHFTEQARWDLYVHEICHVLADTHYQTRCAHGARWKATMLLCGAQPLTYYRACDVRDYDLFAREVRGYLGAPCPGCAKTLWVTKRTAKQVASGRVLRHCKTCKTILGSKWAGSLS